MYTAHTHPNLSYYLSLWVCVIYVVEQNVKILSIYVYHKLYFTH